VYSLSFCILSVSSSSLCPIHHSCTNDHSITFISAFVTISYTTSHKSSLYLRVGIGHAAHQRPDFCKTSSSSFPRSLPSLMLSSLPFECPLPFEQSLRFDRHHQSTNSPKPDPRSSTKKGTIPSTSMLRHTQAEHFL
jgi:hypothetical protein